MSSVNDLIAQIKDEGLRARIQQEVDKISKQKKFGLVFEEHVPECSPLYDVPIRVGSTVAPKDKIITDLYFVKGLDRENGKALCFNKDDQEEVEFLLEELVVVAEFGDPIYPYLKPIDSIENAPDSDLWHTLIEADNYHALQLLEYLYAGKVDCIYIDPPYNTGAKDWKYNNDYVDSSDVYRHSKWLSMMEKRLRLAKKLLNPKDSVLICTIDEKEYLHLGCLLEEIFNGANIQMISSMISRKGAARFNEFTRTNEFIFFVMVGDYKLHPLDNADYARKNEAIHWQTFRRSSSSNVRTSRPRQFYPIYVEKSSSKIVKIGEAITPDVDRFSVKQIPNCVAVFPIRDNGKEMLWGLTPEACCERLKKGYLKASKYNPEKPQQFVIQYLMSGTISDIESGKIKIEGMSDAGYVLATNFETRKIMPKSQWNFPSHDARDYGNKILKDILGTRFDFPKSLYAVRDCLNYFLNEKKNALILDFFAGSGTTLHAINLLNAEDGGNRRCIMVTNNEVSEGESKNLKKKGFSPGDPEWEKLGIAHNVTWPRTVCSIKGHDINGIPLSGTYGVKVDQYVESADAAVVSRSTQKPLKKTVYEKRKIEMYPELSKLKLADGFKANATFFKLGFLDKNTVALGRQFKELLPILWLKSGGKGPCPETRDEEEPDMLILPENGFAVLNDETKFSMFETKVNMLPEINVVYLVTDSESGYREMLAKLKADTTYQLYRDYLDNFRINTRR